VDSGFGFQFNRLFLEQVVFCPKLLPESFEKTAKKENIDKQSFSFMERFGNIGDLLSLQMNLFFATNGQRVRFT